MKLTYEYNEYVIGYVVTDTETGRELNFQFEKVFSNHPAPNFQVFAGCEGDETHEAFTEEEIEEAREWLRDQEGVKDLEKAFTTTFYADPEFQGNGNTVYQWQIWEAAERAEAGEPSEACQRTLGDCEDAGYELTVAEATVNGQKAWKITGMNGLFTQGKA